MNNMMFSLCRYLRDEGIDAHLIILPSEPEHFHPSADSYDNSFESFVHLLDFEQDQLHLNQDKLEVILAPYSFLIGTDLAPYIACLAGRRLNVFVPHGSDIYAYPFYTKPKSKDISKSWWIINRGLMAKIQRLGIGHVDHVILPAEYDKQFPFIKELDTDAVFHDCSAPMLYVPQYHEEKNKTKFPSLEWYDFFEKKRSDNDLLVFSHSRQNGTNLPEDQKIHEKGNDLLIEGFHQFIKKHPEVKASLILFEYGINVEEAKEQINSLGISDSVSWVGKMARKDIMYGLMVSDIGCGEFKNSWLTCGVVNENLALGNVLLHYREDELYSDSYDELYFMLNANTPEGICEKIESYVANKDQLQGHASSGPDWITKYTVEQPLQIIKEAIASEPKTHLESQDIKSVKGEISSAERKKKRHRLKERIQIHLKK